MTAAIVIPTIVCANCDHGPYVPRKPNAVCPKCHLNPLVKSKVHTEHQRQKAKEDGA